MPEPTSTRSATARSLSRALMTAACLSLTAGLIEVAVLTIRHSFTAPIMGLSRDYGWLTPLAVLLPGLLACTGGFALGWIAPRLDPSRTALFVTCCAVALELLLLIPRLHIAASVILALGIGAHLARTNAFVGPVARRRMSRISLAAGLFIVVLGAAPRLVRARAETRALDGLPSTGPAAPNVLLITLDTVRSLDLSLYGYERATTPFLEELGASGVVFEQAISSAPWTLPSHASLFTGRWHHELSVGYRTPLDATFPTLAEQLGEAGYATAGFVANLQYAGYESGLDRGFDHYEDYKVSLGELLLSGRITKRFVTSFRIRAVLGTDEQPNRKTAEELNQEVLRWLDGEADHPFFVFVNYIDAHEPYLPPAPYDTRFGPGRANGKRSPLHHWLYDPSARNSELDAAEVREEIAAYDGAIAYLDDQLRILIEAIRARDDGRPTLIVVTSDHGEEFGEHRVFEHGYSLYRPAVHVPLIVVEDGGAATPEGLRVGEPVSIRDVPATVLDLLGYDTGPFPGASLRTVWEGTAEADATPVLSELGYAPNQPDWFPVSAGDMRSVIIDGVRYILNGDGREELYDYRTDPGEGTNLIGDTAYAGPLARARVRIPTRGRGRN